MASRIRVCSSKEEAERMCDQKLLGVVVYD
jgi:hypothetical protein